MKEAIQNIDRIALGEGTRSGHHRFLIVRRGGRGRSRGLILIRLNSKRRSDFVLWKNRSRRGGGREGGSSLLRRGLA